MVAKPQDGGNCGQPSALGLILFERLSGGGQNHCLCDTGMCMPPSKTGKTIKAGEQPGTFKWDGVNWTGPSDFGNPKGKAFPVGSYTLAVSAKGMIGSGAVSTPFEVLGTMVITLVP